MTVDFPKKLRFLFQPHPYKIAYGGRAGTKSWGFAIALLELGARRKLRIVCARETMKSIADSVHKLLSDQIERLGMQHLYEVQKATIKGKNGTEFLFVGLHHNPASIKSLEGADILWVEEANSVSKTSWNIVMPTIRKKDAEIWVSFNPELETDDTYQRWVLNPPPGAMVQKVGWQENRWLSERTKVEIQHMYLTSPTDAANIYGGECRSAVEGAIFAAELKKATEEGRICKVPYNRERPVDTVWDLGYGDLTAIWFVQAYGGEYHFIDYEEGDGLTIADYLVRLQQKGYLYGTDWIPHDGIDTIIHHKLAGGDRSRSIEMLMRTAGRQVRVVPKLFVTDRINAGRTIFPACRFDADKCADGIQALRHYRWADPPQPGMSQRELQNLRRREPLHDWASHAADSFTHAAIAVKQPKVKQKEAEPEFRPASAWS